MITVKFFDRVNSFRVRSGHSLMVPTVRVRLAGVVLVAAVVGLGCSEDETGRQLDELQTEIQDLRAELAPTTAPTTTHLAKPPQDVVAALGLFWANFHPDQAVNWCNRYLRPGERDYLFGLAREGDPMLYGSLTYLEFISFFDTQCG